MLECINLVRFITNSDKAAELYRKLRLTQYMWGSPTAYEPARPLSFDLRCLTITAVLDDQLWSDRKPTVAN